MYSVFTVFYVSTKEHLLFLCLSQLRSALDRIDELEVSNSHLSKRLEKMKANRNALLAQQWLLFPSSSPETIRPEQNVFASAWFYSK